MKRIVSLLMILILALTLLPAANAEKPASFDLRLSADAAGEGWNWEQAALTLTLDGADLQSENEPIFRLPDQATVAVKSDSRLSAIKTETPTNATFYALQCEGALTLSGEGALTVESQSGGISCTAATVACKTVLKTAVYGLNCGGDAMLQAPLQATLEGDQDKLEETVALFSQGAMTVQSDVSVQAANAACAIKGTTVAIEKSAKIDITNENEIDPDTLAAAGIYSVNAIAGAEGITLSGEPTVNASVNAVGLAECVMAGHTYESSSSVGDLVLEGGSLNVSAVCSETAAFGVGGIHVVVNGGRLQSKAIGTEREDRISAAVVAGRYGGITVGDAMQIDTPNGGYISSDGRTVVNGAGETAAEVLVAAGENGVLKGTVSSGLEWLCLIACLAASAVIAVLVYLRCKKEREQ